MRPYIALLVVLLLSMSVTAVEYAPTDTLEEKIAAVKYHIPFEITGVFGTLFGNERIQMTIFSDDSLVNISAITEDKQLVNFDFGDTANSTMQIDMSEETIISIWTSQDPLATATDALHSGKINYEAKTFGNKIKMPVVSLMSRILSWFR